MLQCSGKMSEEVLEGIKQELKYEDTDYSMAEDSSANFYGTPHGVPGTSSSLVITN